MADWNADLDALVNETIALAKGISHQRPLPREMVERVGLKPMDLGGPEREEISRRVANFKAHQQRFMREREDYGLTMTAAASQLLQNLPHTTRNLNR
jgi:hypothetical protein